MHLLAIDLGTSSVKVLLTSAGGKIVGSGESSYPILHPQPEQAEQDPESWWKSTLQAVREALTPAEAGDLDIAAIGLSGQMHGTVLIDRYGKSLAPAVIWPDRRSRKQAREITEHIGRERLIRLTGSPAATGFQAVTLRWIRSERPQLWQQIGKVLLPKDYLRWRMTGDFYTDPSDASGTLLLDVKSHHWSPEMLAAVGMEAGMLPDIRDSASVTGWLRPEAASAMGIKEGIPVVAGASDVACGLLGAGVTGMEDLLLTLGTGGQVAQPVVDPRMDPRGRVHTFCSALSPEEGGAGYYHLGAILSAGLSLSWLKEKVFELPGAVNFQDLVAMAEDVPPGSGGLIFVPYLAGERTPHMDPNARGLLLGLSLDHGRKEIVRAVMEGVIMACHDAFNVLVELGAAPKSIVMAGGGARSRLWQQMVADVFGLPVQTPVVLAGSALGAALLAGSAIGLFEPTEAARNWPEYHSLVEPDPDRYRLYRRLALKYRTASLVGTPSSVILS